MTLRASLVLAAAAASLALSGTACAAAPQVKELKASPNSILIVGNSYMYYNCGLNGYLSGLLKADGKTKVKTRLAAIGRGNLSQYPIEEYLDNAASISHRENEKLLDPGLLAKEVKKRESYGLVLMQGSNRGADDQARDRHYVPIHAKAIRAQGGEPALIITWTQKKKNAPDFSVVESGVTETANENGMMAIPVGQAFNLFAERHPDITLIMPDQTHPTAAGSYLIASTIYASIYRKSPAEAAAAFEGGCEKPLAADVRQKIAETAWDAARSWFGWQ